MTWVLDLDGVMWRGTQIIDGSPQAVARIKAAGERVIYVTNNSALSTTGYVEKLGSFGVETQQHDIVHAGHAVATLIEEGDRVLVCAGAGVTEAIAGIADVVDVAELTDEHKPVFDAVVVGIRPDYQFEWLSIAIRAVLNGARLIAPSADPLYPSGDTFQIGGGSMIKAIEYATGVTATLAGKPSKVIAGVLQERAQHVEVLVGDQAFTDGQLAAQLDAKFGLVLSGVTRTVPESIDVPVWQTAGNLQALVESTFGDA